MLPRKPSGEQPSSMTLRKGAWSSYVWQWVHEYLMREMSNTEHIVTIPRKYQTVYAHYKTLVNADPEATDEDLMRELSVNAEDLSIIKGLEHKLSLDKETADEGFSLHNTLGVDTTPKADYFDLREAFSQLPEMQKNVLYWLEVEGYSLREVADMIGVSHQGVSNIRKRALKTLWQELVA